MTRNAIAALGALAISAVLTLGSAAPAMAAGSGCTIDIPKPLTFQQWKDEVQMRSEKTIYPEIGLNPDDVRETLKHADSPDCDAWADLWSSTGDRYMAKARTELGRDDKAAD